MKYISSTIPLLLIVTVLGLYIALPIHEAQALSSGSVVETVHIGTIPSPTNVDFWIQYVLNPIARIAIRELTEAAKNQVLGWVQGNGGQNVGFVPNLQQKVLQEFDSEGGQLLNEISGANLCGHIGAFLKISLQGPSQPTTPGGGGLPEMLGCTATQIVDNVGSFFNDFSKGGWIEFNQVMLDPQNNPYGAYLITMDALLTAQSQKKENITAQYQTNSGFLGFETTKCRNTGYASNTKEGTAHQDGTSASGATPVNGKCPPGSETVKSVETPGSLISGMVGKVSVGGIDFGINAKDVDEVVGAIINTLISKITSGGIFGRENNLPPQQQSLATQIPASGANSPYLNQRIHALFSGTNGILTGINTDLNATYKNLFTKEQMLIALPTSTSTQDIPTLIQHIGDLENTRKTTLGKLNNTRSLDPSALQDEATANALIDDLSQTSSDLLQAGMNADPKTIDPKKLLGANTADPKTQAISDLKAMMDTANSYIAVIDTITQGLNSVKTSLTTAQQGDLTQILGSDSSSGLAYKKGLLQFQVADMNIKIGQLPQGLVSPDQANSAISQTVTLLQQIESDFSKLRPFSIGGGTQ